MAEQESLGTSVKEGDYATFVKHYRGFSVFLVGDRYYALTADYGELLSQNVVLSQHSLSGEAIFDLEEEINTAIAFSNSRGHFDNRFRQKTKGTLMKAESVHDNSYTGGADPNLPQGKVVFIEETGEYFFVTPDELPAGLEDLNASFVSNYYASSQPELIGTIANYNIVSFDTKIFTVRQGVPVEDLEWETKAVASRDDVCMFGNTKDAIRYIKSQLRLRRGNSNVRSDDPHSSSPPVLLESDAQAKVNYVFYRDLYYAIPQGLREVNLESFGSTVPEGVIFSDSFDSLKQFYMKGNHEVSQESLPSTADVPKLLKADGDFNIVAFGGYYFAIPHSLGEVDLLEIDFMTIPELFRDVSLHVIEDYITEKKRLAGQDQPREVQVAKVPTSTGGEVKIQLADRLFTLPQSLDTKHVLELLLQMQKLISEQRANLLQVERKQSDQELLVQRLQDEVARMKTSKFWKIRKLWIRLKKALKLTTENPL